MQRQRILFSAYRTDQYSDPDGYLTSLGVVLEQYPDEVIVFITDPRTGVQRISKWPPTISEVVEACDKRVAELAKVRRYENWGQNSQAALLDKPKEDRLSLEELKAKYGPNWGLDATDSISSRPEKTAPSWDQIVKNYQSEPGRLEALLKRDI